MKYLFIVILMSSCATFDPDNEHDKDHKGILTLEKGNALGITLNYSKGVDGCGNLSIVVPQKINNRYFYILYIEIGEKEFVAPIRITPDREYTSSGRLCIESDALSKAKIFIEYDNFSSEVGRLKTYEVQLSKLASSP